MKEPKRINARLSGEDVSAILDALPLIPIYGAETEVQQNINASLCRSVMEKFEKMEQSENKSLNFSANEMRIIALSVTAAHWVLSGRMVMDIPPELREKLKRHFFTYNRLASVYAPVLGEE